MNTAERLFKRLLDAKPIPQGGLLLVLESDEFRSLPKHIQLREENYPVREARTEVGLRHLIWRAKGAPLIVIVTQRLAEKLQRRCPDILRSAVNQRVHAPLDIEVLEVNLGFSVHADNANMISLALDQLAPLRQSLSSRTVPTAINQAMLVELLLEITLGDKAKLDDPGALLALWLKRGEPKNPRVRAFLQDSLPARFGPRGRLLAWGLEAPQQLDELLIRGALLAGDLDSIPAVIWGPMLDAQPVGSEKDFRNDPGPFVLRRALTSLAETALTHPSPRLRELLNRADKLARENLAPEILQTNPLLPLALSNRADSLSKAAAEGHPVSGADVDWLKKHRAAADHQPEIKVIAAMARLSRYLNEAPAPEDDFKAQIEGFQRSGAFAEWGISQLRAALAESAAHHGPAAELLRKVRARRDRENLRFAECLGADYESKLHCEGVTPLHRIYRRVLNPILDREENIYLVVLDGCSYPVFLSLVDALQQTQGIGIISEQAVTAGLPALAPLPTITRYARGALFLGELPDDALLPDDYYEDKPEAKTDKARLQQNHALAERSRVLFLKGDLNDGGQALTAALRAEAPQLVAAVFNAIDDQIGSSNTGSRIEIAPQQIAGFVPSLKAALEAKRRVFLTADHGHSLYSGNTLRRGEGRNPRYLELDEGEPPPEGFIEIDLGQVSGAEQERRRMAFAWQGGVYLGRQQVGFHGGCSLEEMVVPMAELNHNGLPADEPSWWWGSRFAVAPQARQVAKEQSQLPFGPAPEEDTLGLPTELAAQLKPHERQALRLIRKNGAVRSDALAKHLKRKPVRVTGMMAKLHRRLNGAGHALFRSDKLPDGAIQYTFVEQG